MKTMTASRTLRSVFATVVLGAFACSLATICTAAQPTESPQMTVKFADLDVSNPEGAATLYGRIQRAALLVCRPLEELNFRSAAHEACMHDAIAGAVAKVNRPALLIVYNAHNPQPTPIVLAATQGR